MAAMYREGERVDGLYDENTDEMWYPGRIRCVHLGEDSADGPTFEVLYDDGEVEMHVQPEFLRQHVPGTICVGTRVLCRYDGGEEFYPGKVSDVQENGMYTIAYDDGEVEEDVPLDHITEPKGYDEGDAEDDETTDDTAVEQQEDVEVEDIQDYPRNPADNADSATGVNEQRHVNEGRRVWDTEPIEQPRAQPARQKEDHPEPTPSAVSAERTHIIESLQQLEKRLGDAASTKSVLSTLVKQMRAYPQITADLLHERGGERLIIDSLKFHQTHAVIQCYGFVLLRRLCFLCVKSTQYLLRNGIVELVMQAMNAFAEDAILQASACGALAVFTRIQTGLNSLIEYQVAQLVLSTLTYHKTYSVHTRQVHYYACEVLLELCELDDLQTLNLLCGEQDDDFTGDMSPVSLLLFLLRQCLSLDDKKACCAVGSLLMCLAASGRRAAALILGLNGLAELSTVMARYPTEPSIQKYSAPASKQIALSSFRQSPTKRVKETATEILREAESLENTPRERQPTKRSVPRGRSTGIGKHKSNPTAGYGAPKYPRGAVYTSGTPYRSGQGFSKVSSPSPYGQGTPGFGGDTNYAGYPARDYTTTSTAPQQPSSLVFLDEMDSGFGSTSKRKQSSKEDRQSELFDAYGIRGIPNKPYGTKRSQLKAHLASAESAWAAPPQHDTRHGSSTSKIYLSRSEHLDHGSAYSHRDYGQNRWDYGNDEPQNSVYDPAMRQNRGAKRKKKTTVPRTAFQVRVENDNQLRVSRETRSPYPSPQRLGVATKRAAKARQKRITGATHPPLTGRTKDTSSESLNDYATQLFQDNAARVGINIPTTSKLTPREKEEIRERERLSFAEKLHKMIDKAKSSLANGNTTSLPSADDAVRSKKVAASSKVVRKTREPPTDEKRPLSKKNRTTVSITPKNTAKEVSSPREAAETRPPKLISGFSKRQAPNDAQPAVPRAKPIASRSVVTPKGTADPKPRTAVKSSKPTASKLVDKHNTEKDNTFAETVPDEVVPVNAIAIEEQQQAEPVAVASESVVVPAQSSEQGIAPSESVAAEQVEPNNEFVQVKAGVEPEEAALESEVGAATAEPGDENGDVVPKGEENVVQVTDKNAVSSTPVEGEVVADFENVTPSIDVDPAPENGTNTTVEAPPESSEPLVDAEQPGVEEPSDVLKSGDDGASTIADAMYGDDCNEFDDNGDDEEDMTLEDGADTDGADTPATGTAVPTIDVPLQVSKSGEALYDDGYNEFDDDVATEEAEVEDAPTTVNTEPSDAIAVQANAVVPDPAENYDEFDDDEATKEAEAEDAPTTEAVNTQPSDAIFIQANEDAVSDPAENAFEVEAEQLVAQSETPSVAAVEEAVPVTTEGEVGHESLEHDTNEDAQKPHAEVDAPESEDVVIEPEEAYDPQLAAVDDDNTQVDETQNELNSPEVNAEGELNAGTATDVDSNILDGVNAGAEPGDESHLDPVDLSGGENADGATTIENEPIVPEVEKGDVEAAPEAEIDDVPPTVEPTEEEGDVNIPQTDVQAADSDAEVQKADTPGESVDANDCVANAQDDSPVDVEETDKQPEEPLVAIDASPLLEQNPKKLAPDSSDASIQSAGYDEENFDDEEDHQEVRPTEEAGDPVVTRVEEPVQVVDKQEVDTLENAEASENATTANTAADTTECVEEESKGLVANSSDVSVQSAAYDDDDFDKGEQEESSHKQSTEVGNQVPENQEMSAVEDVVDPDTNLQSGPVDPVDEAPTEPECVREEEKVNIDTEAPSADPESNEDATVQDDTLSEVTPESTVAGVTKGLSEQQVEHNDFPSNAEPGIDNTASTVAVESEVPVPSKEESDDNVKEPVADEADQYADDLDVNSADEVALEDDNSSTAPAANNDDPSALLSVVNANPSETSAESDASVNEAPEIPITPPAGEGALEDPDSNAQPEAYDDDDFGDDGEEEQSPPSAEGQSTGESLQNGAPNAQPSVEQTSSDVCTPAPEVTDSTDDPVTTLEVLTESEQLAEENPPSPADEAEPSVALDTANDFVSEVPIESESAVSPVVDVVNQAEPPSTANDVGSSIEEVVNPGPDVALPELDLQPANPNNQPSPPEDSADPEPESATASVLAEEVPGHASETADPVEVNGADVVVAETSDATEVNTVDTTQNTTAEELPGYTKCDDAFEEDPTPTPADVSVLAETTAEPSTELDDDENQYEDAGFDDENDVATATDVVSENEIAQTESGVGEEVSSAGKSSADEPSCIEVAQAEVHDATETTEDQLAEGEEASSPATEIQEKVDTLEAPELVEDADDYADDTQGAGDTDTTVETKEAVDDTSDNAEHDFNSTPEAEAQDAVDATAYDEDFPSELPETHEDAAVETTASPGKEESITSDNAVAEAESPAVADNELHVPDLGADDSAQASTAPVLLSTEEQYDEGFDDENTVADPSDAENTADATPTTEMGSVGSADVPENSGNEETPHDSAMSESEQLNEGQAPSDDADLTTPESAVQEEGTVEPAESAIADSVHAGPAAVSEPVVAEPEVGSANSDEVGPEAADSETTPEPIDAEVVDAEPAPLESVGSEAVDSEFTSPKSVELESVEPEAVEPDSVETEAMEPEPVEPESVEPEAVEPESVETEAMEPEPVEPESVEPEAVEPESVETEAVEPEPVEPECMEAKTVEPEPVEPESVEVEAVEPESVEPESVEAEAVEPELVEPDAVEPEPVEPVTTESELVEPEAAEGSAVESKRIESAAVKPEVVQFELSELNAVESGSSEAEAVVPGVVDDAIETVGLEPAEPVSVEQGTTDSEIVEAKAPTQEAAVSGIEEPEAASEASQEEPQVDPLGTPTLPDPVTIDDESLPATEAVVEADVDVPTVTSDSSPIAEGDANNANGDAPVEVDVIDPPQSDESTDNAESPQVEEAPVADNPTDTIPDTAPDASEELAIEADPPKPDVEDAAEDQYDDGYNEFDDQDTVPAEPTLESPAADQDIVPAEPSIDFDDQDNVPAEPSIESPAAVTEPPATEDDYEDYENEDYAEEQVETPIPEPVLEQPVSSRSEIEEVTDEPEEAEDEAYADDPDEYEEDDTLAPPPITDPPAEASADDYEDDNEEEEFAEDELDETSPRPVAAKKPDVEAEDEVDYDSDYAESD